MVWMHMLDHGKLQKYPIAVDEKVPLTEEGLYLFSQLENSNNCVLTILEKAWNKYVYLNHLKDYLQGRYIDRIILAFLGAPTMKLKVEENYGENDLQKIKRTVHQDLEDEPYSNKEKIEK
jgi:hypothetical protein